MPTFTEVDEARATEKLRELKEQESDPDQDFTVQRQSEYSSHQQPGDVYARHSPPMTDLEHRWLRYGVVCKDDISSKDAAALSWRD